MAKKPTRLEMNHKRVVILNFALDNNLVVNPAKGMEDVLATFLEFGYCPCDPTKSRTQCPCDQVMEDIAQTGHCLCRLFWKDIETFKKLYEVKDEKVTSEAD